MGVERYETVQDDEVLTGYESIVSDLKTLIATYPPPFIFVHDPLTPRISASIIRSVLSDIYTKNDTHIFTAAVNAITCFTPRLLYDTVLNALACWQPDWDEGCSNWTGPADSQGYRYNESFDAFLHGLRALKASVSLENVKGKGKGRAVDVDDVEYRFILMIERAERLKDAMPDLMVPLTRLAELSQLEIAVIMHSNMQWEFIRPPFGASLDPYHIAVPPLSREAIIERLLALYPSSAPGESRTAQFDPDTYHPNLKPLYNHFLSALYGICSLYVRDPDELAYIAAARWPGFVQPVLDEYRRRLEFSRRTRSRSRGSDVTEGMDGDAEDEMDAQVETDDENITTELAPPDEHTRMRLVKLFTESTSKALEHLYPRRTSAFAWAHANTPPRDLLSIPPRQVPSIPARLPPDCTTAAADLNELPRMAKFVLVAAFLASTNPAKTDMRMFGRGLDERKKKRKRGGPRKQSAKNAAVKIPQRLLGPMPFPLDRMLAILGVLLEENDAEMRLPAPEYELPGEYTEMEISRVAVYAQVKELTAMHLLHRISPADRLEMAPMYKCGVGYDAALILARDVEISLHDLMWEPV